MQPTQAWTQALSPLAFTENVNETIKDGVAYLQSEQAVQDWAQALTEKNYSEAWLNKMSENGVTKQAIDEAGLLPFKVAGAFGEAYGMNKILSKFTPNYSNPDGVVYVDLGGKAHGHANGATKPIQAATEFKARQLTHMAIDALQVLDRRTAMKNVNGILTWVSSMLAKRVARTLAQAILVGGVDIDGTGTGFNAVKAIKGDADLTTVVSNTNFNTGVLDAIGRASEVSDNTVVFMSTTAYGELVNDTDFKGFDSSTNTIAGATLVPTQLLSAAYEAIIVNPEDYLLNIDGGIETISQTEITNNTVTIEACAYVSGSLRSIGNAFYISVGTK